MTLSSESKPPRVGNVELYWTIKPPQQSARCTWWLKRFADGWRPNRRVSSMGYHCKAEFFGVWIWEYLHVLSPMLDELVKVPGLEEIANKASDRIAVNQLEADARTDWYNHVLTNSNTIDPHDEFTWEGVAIGFFLGRGLPIERARQLASEVEL